MADFESRVLFVMMELGKRERGRARERGNARESRTQEISQ
jgi:hypothetical protein